MDPQLTEMKDILKRIELLVKGAVSTAPPGPGAGTKRTPAASRTRGDAPVIATSKALDELEGSASTLNRSFIKLNASITNTRKALSGMRFGRQRGGVAGSATSPASPQTQAADKAVSVKTDEVKQQSIELAESFKLMLRVLQEGAMEVGSNFLFLQKRGIDAAGSLGGLYVDAIKSGMSLEDYTRSLELAGPAVTRSLNFDDFRKKLDPTLKDLKGLGIFGREATELAASMAGSTTALGVPQEQLSSQMQGQVKIFENLRKTTAMTAEGFRQLAQMVAENSNVQDELLGMAPQERAARSLELHQIGMLGARLGMTEEASRRLTQALLDQRKASASERFKQAGLIRQAGALSGMSSQDTEELAMLSRKKNKTEAESARQVELAGQLKSGLQAMQNSGQIGQEYISEQMEELLQGTKFGSVYDAAGEAKLAKDSGPAGQNEKFGKSVGEFGQGVQKFVEVMGGLAQNPFGKAILSLGGIIGGALVQALATAAIFKRLMPGAGGATGSAASSAASGLADYWTKAKDLNSKATNVLMKPFGWIADAGSAIKGGTVSFFKALPGVFTSIGTSAKGVVNVLAHLPDIWQSVKGVFGSVKTLFGQVGGAGKQLFSLGGAKDALMGLYKGANVGLGGLTKMFKVGGPISFVFGAIEEAFTGEMANSLGLGNGIFGRILGAVIAGFNGIFTGISRLFDDAVNWLLEGLGIDFKVNTTKLIDYATSVLVDFFKMMTSIWMKGAATVLETVTGFFGLKPPFVAALREKADAIDASIAESGKNREEMWKTEGATLRSVGEKNLKAQEATSKKSDAAAANTLSNTNKVLTATAGIAGSLVAEADRMKAAGVTQATPATQVQKSVTQPEVNSTEEKKTETEKKAAAAAAAAPQDTVALLQQMLDVLKQQLSVENAQLNLSDDMLRRLNRPGFSDNVALYNKAIRPAA